ncbi:hypothetical protein W97_06900 [Coniosporium apollinis CBS 100218]|uniref:Uncharacterized protein n=1 Tax=Coniosporium apollinis (strain CBS 100218) TaxID=1168221 RepID=R7Z058_CONA1|nr:uncharacterized protein W97_06900 [Coniosporium apollinis CBS 100218]EON67532.1 hypothetical protein W97_06900 [Coniosporium apollinis CBS 100218]
MVKKINESTRQGASTPAPTIPGRRSQRVANRATGGSAAPSQPTAAASTAATIPAAVNTTATPTTAITATATNTTVTAAIAAPATAATTAATGPAATDNSVTATNILSTEQTETSQPGPQATKAVHTQATPDVETAQHQSGSDLTPNTDAQQTATQSQAATGNAETAANASSTVIQPAAQDAGARIVRVTAFGKPTFPQEARVPDLEPSLRMIPKGAVRQELSFEPAPNTFTRARHREYIKAFQTDPKNFGAIGEAMQMSAAESRNYYYATKWTAAPTSYKKPSKAAGKSEKKAAKQAGKQTRKAAKSKAAEEAGEEPGDDSEPESEDEPEAVVEEVDVHLPPYELTSEEFETYNKLFPPPTPPPANVLAEAISSPPAPSRNELTAEELKKLKPKEREAYNKALEKDNIELEKYNKHDPLLTPPPAKLLAKAISSLPALPVVEEEAANSAGPSPDTAKATKSKPKGAGPQVPKQTDSSGNGTDDESGEDSDDDEPPGGSKVRDQESAKSPPKAAGSPPAPPRSDRSTSTTNTEDLYKMPSPRPSQQTAPAASKEASTDNTKPSGGSQSQNKRSSKSPPKADASRAPPGYKPTNENATESDDESRDSSGNAKSSGSASAGKRKRDLSKSDATESRPAKKTRTADTKTNDDTKGPKRKSTKKSTKKPTQRDNRFDEEDPSLTRLTVEDEPLTTDWSPAVVGGRFLEDGTDQLEKLKVVYVDKKTQKKVRAVYTNGTPKDWNDQAVITLINKWRSQRHRRGPEETNRPARDPWSDGEVALLRRIHAENPGISPSAAYAKFNAESTGSDRSQDAVNTKWSNLVKKDTANNAPSTVTKGAPSNKSGLKLRLPNFKSPAEDQEEEQEEKEKEEEDDDDNVEGEEEEEEIAANDETEGDTEVEQGHKTEDDANTESGSEIETEEASATESESTSGSGKRKRGGTPEDIPSGKRRKS